MIKYADDPKNRDLTMVKTYDQCKEKYHPRKNSYQIVSLFCSAECSRKGTRIIRNTTNPINTLK
mgnify:CR=1 FL=1